MTARFLMLVARRLFVPLAAISALSASPLTAQEPDGPRAVLIT